MRHLSLLLFGLILLSMLGLTTYASRDRGILHVGPELMSDPWFHATLADAYFGFLTFYLWVFYKEATIARRILWFVLIMTLGNIAMSIYMILQIRSASDENFPASILIRSDS